MSPQQGETRQRLRGFDAPLSCNQILSWVGNVVVTGSFYALCLYLLFGKSQKRCNEKVVAILLLVKLVLVFGGFCSWLFLETHPPNKPSFFGRCLPKNSTRWNKRRYCREHRDIILGLDHFCTWLNTAIGRENFIPFYTLALFGVLHYSLHLIISIFILATCTRIGSILQSLFILLAFFAALILCAYSALFFFHTYLIFIGIGTYDWILQQQQAETSTTTNIDPSSKPKVTLSSSNHQVRHGGGGKHNRIQQENTSAADIDDEERNAGL